MFCLNQQRLNTDATLYNLPSILKYTIKERQQIILVLLPACCYTADVCTLLPYANFVLSSCFQIYSSTTFNLQPVFK